jgi:hypothetical protein
MVSPLRVVEDGIDLPKLRCAPFHAELAVDPVGTAGAYDVFLCVEVPLPWQRDISSNEPFLSLLGAGTASVKDPHGRTIRPQGLVPRPGAEGWTRVLLFAQPDGPAAGPYRRREWWLDADEVPELCRSVIEADDAALAAFDERRVEVPAQVIDLFVCTHGKRDACCGSSGAVLHDQLAAALGPEPGPTGLRLWRTSHTGGHRFAPTALSFPDGYAWAHLDLPRAMSLLTRDAGPAELAGNCRGSSALPAGPAQAADRAGLAEVGWIWAEARRTAVVTGFDRASMATEVRIEGELPGGTVVAFDVRVELDRHVPQPTCGVVDGPEYKVEPAWKVSSVTPVGDRGRE